ncbi:MAG: helix-turn-helix domain-containing protein [Umezawaea sp.]
MQLRYNFRPYPELAQCEALTRAFGCARVVFNDGLRARQTARANGEKYLSDGELSKQSPPRSRRRSGRGWAKSPRSCCNKRWPI